MNQLEKQRRQMIYSKLGIVLLLVLAISNSVNLLAEEKSCETCAKNMANVLYGAIESKKPAMYYVSCSGNDNANGKTQKNAFQTIGKAVRRINASGEKKHFKIWIKAGLYENEVIPSLKQSNVVIEGYQKVPGDINQSVWGKKNYYTLRTELSETHMPLIVGNYGDDVTAFGAVSKNNIVLRNLQIKDYKEGGIRTSNVNESTFENIFIYSTRSQSGKHSQGAGLLIVGNKCKIHHCAVVNSWGSNIAINGNDNHAHNCVSACLENATDNGTDYYFLTNGDRNLITSCTLTRTHQGSHGGHGFMIQMGQCNQIYDCKTIGISEAVQLIALKGPTENNCFKRLNVSSGRIVLSTQANFNKFQDCEIVRGGVSFWRSYPLNLTSGGHKIFGYAASNNKFYNCNFKNSSPCINFGYGPDKFPWKKPAKDNQFFGCTFEDADVLVRTARPNTGTTFAKCKFSRILNYLSDEGTTLDDTDFDIVYEPFDNPQFTDCDFIDNGFPSPQGKRNSTTDKDLKFPPKGDIDSGLVAHFKFDEVDAKMTYDSRGRIKGILQGNAALVNGGKLMGCLSLDGVGAFVNCGNKLGLVEEKIITIACWIKPEDKRSSAIVGKLGGGGYLITRNDDSRITGFTRGPSGERQHATYKSKLPSNQWHHIAVVFDSGKLAMHFYIDGIIRETGGGCCTRRVIEPLSYRPSS